MKDIQGPKRVPSNWAIEAVDERVWSNCVKREKVEVKNARE